MAVTFLCGAECQIVSGIAGATHWNAPTGTPAASLTTFEGGGGIAAFRFNTAAATAFMSLTIARTIVSGRFYFFVAAYPSVTQSIVSAAGTGGNALIRMTTTGAMSVQAVSTGATLAGGSVALNTWHYIDFTFNTSGASMVVTGRLDGNAQNSASSVLASANMTNVRFGATVAATGDFFVDHIILGDALADYPFGPGQVTGYAPTSTGTHNQTAGDFTDQVPANITNGDGTWANVDERPANTTDFTAQVVIRTTSYAEYVYGTAGVSQDPRAVEQVISVQGGTLNAEKAQLFDGTTAADAYALAATIAGVTNRTKQWAAPPTGGAWTAALLRAARIRWGFSNDVTPNPQLTSTILEAEFSGVPALMANVLQPPDQNEQMSGAEWP